jgi:hypothetical protein
MQYCSNLEWNALTRFRKALMSETAGDAFEAQVGIIDVLGKNDFQNSSVKRRMMRYLVDRLGVDAGSATILVKARHEKIHENAYDPTFFKPHL